MHETDDAFDVIILIMTLAIFVPFMVYCTVPLFKGEVGGFNVQIEKTALETEAEIIADSKEKLTTNDVLLMLVIADQFTPEPRKIRFNVAGNAVERPLDDEFLLNKEYGIQYAKAVMPDNINIDLDLYVGPSGMRFWNVKEAQP